MIGLNFKDVFIEGNKAGFAIGGVPTVNSNDMSPTAACRSLWKPGISSRSPTTSASLLVCSGFRPERREDRQVRQVTVDGSTGDVWGGIVKTEFKF